MLIVPWIGYKKETVPDFTGMLNIEHLGFLELSHCKVTDSLFSQIPVKCPMLKFLLIQIDLPRNYRTSLHRRRIQKTPKP